MTPTAVIEPSAVEVAPGHTSAPSPRDLTEPTRAALTARFVELAQLSADWDSYGARPVDEAALRAGLGFLEGLLGAVVPVPDVLPVPDGGVQLEWTTSAVQLELEFEPGGNSAVFVCDDYDANQQIDGELPRDQGLFGIAIQRLVARQ